MKHFKKVIQNQFTVNGTAISFEPLGGDLGVIAVEENDANADVLAALNAAADGRRNGIVRISAEIYDSLKKNGHSVRSRPKSPSLGGLRVSRMPDPFAPKRPAPAVVSAADVDDGRKPAAVQGSEIPPSSIRSFRARTLRASDVKSP